jgi:hypothetical protein
MSTSTTVLRKRAGSLTQISLRHPPVSKEHPTTPVEGISCNHREEAKQEQRIHGKSAITGDSKLNNVMKAQALWLGKKKFMIHGEAVWPCAEKYNKSKIINLYQFVFKEDPPSGTTSLNDILEVCCKKVWFKEQIKKVISKGGDKPSSWKDCSASLSSLLTGSRYIAP